MAFQVDHPRIFFFSVNWQIFSTKSFLCFHLAAVSDHTILTQDVFLSSLCFKESKQHRGGSRTSNFYKFIVYYTLLKLLCLFIVFPLLFYDNSKRIQKKDENKVFCLHYKKSASKTFFFLLQSLRCYVSFSSSPFRASFIIVLARRHHLSVVFCLDVNYYDYEGILCAVRLEVLASTNEKKCCYFNH